MIVPSDEDYKLTKLIKQGKATMNTDFNSLAQWIDKTYAVKTMNILYDILEDGVTPRIHVIFETDKEAAKFKASYGFDRVRQQEVLIGFHKLFTSQGLIQPWGINKLFGKNNSRKYKVDGIFFIFSAFIPIAIIEANWSIPEVELQNLQVELNIDDLWKIRKDSFGTATFFFYTNKQVGEYESNGIKTLLTEKYFRLIRKFDEFDYLEKDQFQIELDSRENFEEGYKGNWFYYDRR